MADMGPRIFAIFFFLIFGGLAVDIELLNIGQACDTETCKIGTSAAGALGCTGADGLLLCPVTFGIGCALSIVSASVDTKGVCGAAPKGKNNEHAFFKFK